MIRKYEKRAEQVVSGFKSPADDYLEGRLDITDRLIIDPECTFYFRMDGDEMVPFGLQPADILIVDKSLKATHGAIVIAVVQGELRCRLYEIVGNQPLLKGRTDTFKPGNDEIIHIWGVVTAVCRGVLPEKLRKGNYRNVCAL